MPEPSPFQLITIAILFVACMAIVLELLAELIDYIDKQSK